MAAAQVQVVAVHLPATLDRRQIVRESAPNKLQISDHERWGAPLPDMTRGVLSQDLLLRLPAGRLILPEEPTPSATGAISVDILQFGAGADGDVLLNGSWSLTPAGSDAAGAGHRFELRQHAPAADSAEQAHAMSTLLGELADAIAKTLSELPNPAH